MVQETGRRIELNYKRVLKAFYEDMGNYQRITKIYKSDKDEMITTYVDEDDGEVKDLFHIDISNKVNLDIDDTIVIQIWVAGILYDLVQVYPIAYTMSTDNPHIMFCYTDGKYKSRIVCIDSNYKVIRNDFKKCIINETTMPPLPKKKKKFVKKY